MSQLSGPYYYSRVGGLVWFVYIASLQRGDLRLSNHSSGQGADGKARTRDSRVLAGLRADSLSTVPRTKVVGKKLTSFCAYWVCASLFGEI
ncbi:hypothetical protein PoB_003738500 [Plakobranchus ocellatus]|uniref:Uncharacterized protein n=1 Tax=Plakobranchus ocellatus TaxID=259542 RepID=A0AAV4AU86_9GAST|nr:hypothetical protein PoB_003738500 [Plakobranchus ocellatus]